MSFALEHPSEYRKAPSLRMANEPNQTDRHQPDSGYHPRAGVWDWHAKAQRVNCSEKAGLSAAFFVVCHSDTC